MVNLGGGLSTFFLYNLTSVLYKPTPSISTGDAVTSFFNTSQHVIASPHAQTLGNSDPDSCSVDPYNAPSVEDQEFSPYDQTAAHVYRYRQQRSVNLGSWFVHEQWMTPSIFECASGPKLAEIDIASGWGSVHSAQAVLKKHWDTFITESDFEYLAKIGINTVRLPIGYWNLGPDYTQGTAFESVAQVYQNSWPRIVRAINQAGRYGLGVLVDLHGAVGSQNGQQHSGVSDGQTNFFNVPSNMDKTVNVLRFLAQQLAPVNNVVGIQILNEPQYVPGLTDFYSRAIQAIRETSPTAATLPLYLHDGFDLDKFSDFMVTRTDFVVQDHHSYFVFSPTDKTETGTQHTSDVHGAIAESLRRVSDKLHRNLVIDEFSCALTPESLENNKDATQVRKQFCAEQIKVYSNATAGWGFWSYKKEECDSDPGWCFTAAVGRSLPKTFFPYEENTSGSTRKTKAQAKGLAKDSANTVLPTVSKELKDFVPTVESGAQAWLGSRATPDPRHRFEVIHHQRARGEAASGSGQNSDTTTQSNKRGYTDGMTTAKVFASYGPGMSKLGFTGQFMSDAMAVAGVSLIAVGTEEGYRSGFMQGLKDGEREAGASS